MSPRPGDDDKEIVEANVVVDDDECGWRKSRTCKTKATKLDIIRSATRTVIIVLEVRGDTGVAWIIFMVMGGGAGEQTKNEQNNEPNKCNHTEIIRN